jgi:hypothetical protein
MLPIETQEAIIVKSFFDELQKHAGVLGDFTDAAKFISKSRGSVRKIQKGEKLIAKGKSLDTEANKILESTPIGERLKPKGVSRKALIGAGALGLGAAGYGYYQYKRDLNDQAGRDFTQVS